MKKKLIALVGVMALGASLAIAGEGQGRHGRPGARGENLMEKLNLSDAQRTQIDQIRKSTMESNAALFAESRAIREEMRAAHEAKDTARIDALKGRIEAQRPQMKQIHDAEMAQIMTVLNDEQKAKFKALKAEGAAKARRGGHGKH